MIEGSEEVETQVGWGTIDDPGTIDVEEPNIPIGSLASSRSIAYIGNITIYYHRGINR